MYIHGSSPFAVAAYVAISLSLLRARVFRHYYYHPFFSRVYRGVVHDARTRKYTRVVVVRAFRLSSDG